MTLISISSYVLLVNNVLVYFDQKKSSLKSFRRHRASIASTSPKNIILDFHPFIIFTVLFECYIVETNESEAVLANQQ